jgi:hypothetical protein
MAEIFNPEVSRGEARVNIVAQCGMCDWKVTVSSNIATLQHDGDLLEKQARQHEADFNHEVRMTQKPFSFRGSV